MNSFDFLVLGSGIAGLSFALKVSAHGRVAIITKKNRAESNTNYAQGGIAAVTSKEDSFEMHVRDTIEAGAPRWRAPAGSVPIPAGGRGRAARISFVRALSPARTRPRGEGRGP